MYNHIILSITGPHEATSEGSLDYYSANCKCGHAATASLEMIARNWGWEHVDYANRKELGSSYHLLRESR